jgi:hypothetical protein
VIIAVAGVDMVQPAIDQPVDMIAVRHRLVPAAGAMDMGADRRVGAAIRIGSRNRDHMFIDMIAMDMVEMTIVQIIDMAIVAHGGVAAAGAMAVGMIGMLVAGHGQAFLFAGFRPAAGAPPEADPCAFQVQTASDETASLQGA